MRTPGRSLGDPLAFLLFALSLVCAAWVVVPLPSLAFGAPKILVLAAGALLLSTTLLFEREGLVLGALPAHPAGRWLLLYALTVPLSLLWSVAPQLSVFGASPRFEGALTHGLYIALALLGAQAAGSKEGRRLLVGCMVIANAGVVAYGLLQVAGLDPFAGLWGSDVLLGRTFSSIGQPNSLALFLVLTVPFVLLAARLQPRSRRWAGLLLFLLNVVVLLSTVSRSAILGMAAALLLGMFWSRGKKRTAFTRKQWAGMVACALLLAALGAYYAAERFSVPTERGRSEDSRMIIWAGAADMVAARPLGYGLETFGILSARHMSERLLRYESLTTRVDRAHSQPLQLLLTLGPLGFLAYYGFLGTLLLALWHGRKSGGGPYELAGFLSLAGASVTLLFGFDTPITAAYFWLVAGMMLGPMLPATARKRWEYPAWLALVAVLTCLLVISVQWSRARYRMDRAEQWFNAGQLIRAVGEYASAAEEFRFDRHLLTQAVETDLIAMERAADSETAAGLRTLMEIQLRRLRLLTGGEDGMAPLLEAWGEAIRGDGDAVGRLLLEAGRKRPAGVVHYRIALHCYELLGDRGKMNEAYDALIRVLPPSWREPESPHGRLLWKEHPWLSSVREYEESRLPLPSYSQP